MVCILVGWRVSEFNNTCPASGKRTLQHEPNSHMLVAICRFLNATFVFSIILLENVIYRGTNYYIPNQSTIKGLITFMHTIRYQYKLKYLLVNHLK